METKGGLQILLITEIHSGANPIVSEFSYVKVCLPRPPPKVSIGLLRYFSLGIPYVPFTGVKAFLKNRAP